MWVVVECRVCPGRSGIRTFSSLQAALLLVVLMLVAFFFLRSLGYVRFARIQGSAVDRKRNRAMRATLQPLGRLLRLFARAGHEHRAPGQRRRSLGRWRRRRM